MSTLLSACGRVLLLSTDEAGDDEYLNTIHDFQGIINESPYTHVRRWIQDAPPRGSCVLTGLASLVQLCC